MISVFISFTKKILLVIGREDILRIFLCFFYITRRCSLRYTALRMIADSIFLIPLLSYRRITGWSQEADNKPHAALICFLRLFVAKTSHEVSNFSLQLIAIRLQNRDARSRLHQHAIAYGEGTHIALYCVCVSSRTVRTLTCYRMLLRPRSGISATESEPLLLTSSFNHIYKLTTH